METYTLEKIKGIVTEISKQYHLKEVFLFGSYARGEATKDSDLDFLVICQDGFRRTLIYAFAEELREAFQKDVDVFEIHEINENSDFSRKLMKERLKIA